MPSCTKRSRYLSGLPNVIDWKESVLNSLAARFYDGNINSPALKRLRTLQSQHVPPQLQPASILQPGVIYAICHSNRDRPRIYIGQTIRSAFDRFKSHVDTAKHKFTYKQRFSINQNDSEADELHKFIFQHGMQDLIVFPLQIVPGSYHTRKEFKQLATPFEGRWIRWANSMSPMGYNQRLESAVTPSHRHYPPALSHFSAMHPRVNARVISDSSTHRQFRIYGYRNYTRRIQALAHYAQHETNYITVHLNKYKFRHLPKMKVILQNTALSDLDFRLPFHFKEHHRIKLINALNTAIQQHMHTDKNKTANKKRALVVPYFMSPVLDAINLPHIFAMTSVLQQAPQQLTACPLLAFKYAQPLATHLYNYKATALLPHTEQQQILQSESCVCAKHPELVPPGHDHIITTSPAFLPSVNLQQIWQLGSKHRTSHLKPLDNELRSELLHLIRNAVFVFATKMEKKFRTANCMKLWQDAVMLEVTHKMNQLPNKFVFHVDGEVAVQPTPLLTQHDLHLLATETHTDFVLTMVDKASSTPVAYCKKYYLQVIQNDLYDPEHHYYDTNVRIDELEILQDHKSFYTNNHLYSPPDKHLRLPFIAAIAKLHKQPIRNRFLICSHDTSLTSLSRWLGFFFKAILKDIHAIWKMVLQHLGREGKAVSTILPDAWLINSSAEAIPIIQAYNAHFSAEQHASAGCPVKCLDFERLYTNLPISDMIHRLTKLVEKVFLLHNKSAVKIFKHDPPLWQQQASANVTGSEDRKGQYLMFTVTTFRERLGQLVNNTFFTFGQKTFRQIKGIPMGTNCAVYLANYYLFSYEFDFLSQLRHIRDRQIVKCILWNFAFTVRYIDDLMTIGNSLIELLMYKNQNYQGVHGMYPEFLSLSMASEGPNAHFMDLTVCTSFDTTCELPFGALTTLLYDKRREPAYDHFTIVKFPFASSKLSYRCKYNILDSQFHRYRRIILDKKNFIIEMASLIKFLVQHRGYSLHFLTQRLHILLHDWKGMYAATDPEVLFSAIISRV